MYDELLKFAVQLAKAAGGIQLAYFRGDRLSIETKSNVYDVVTRADRESEELIAGMIAERYPDHAILGEEGGCRGNAASDSRRRRAAGHICNTLRGSRNASASGRNRRSPPRSSPRDSPTTRT